MPNRDLRLRIFGEDKTASATLDKVARKAQSTGAQLAGKLGVKIGIAGVAAALAGIGSLGVAYEDSLNTFEAVSGATDAQMRQVGQTAKQLGADLTLPATSAAGAATAMTELAKAGLSVQESMAAAKGTLALAAAAAVDEATAAQMVGTALNAFSLSGDQATRVADLLAGASNAASGEMTDMSAALQQAGTVAAAAGLSVDDTVAAISMLAQKGILGSDAGTSLKTMLMKLQGPSNVAAKELQRLGISAYDANGQMLPLRDLIEVFSSKMSGLTQAERDKANATIFGTDATRAALTVLQGGVGTFDDMSLAVSRQGQALETAAAKSKGLGGAARGLQSTAETLAITFYEKVAPGATEVVEALTDLLGIVGPVALAFVDLVGIGLQAAGWLADHPALVMAAGGAYAAYLAPQLLVAINRFKSMILLKVIDFLVGGATATERMGKGLGKLNVGAVAAGAGIGALVSVGITWWQSWNRGADEAIAKLDEVREGFDIGDARGFDDATTALQEYADEQRAVVEGARGLQGAQRPLAAVWDQLSGKTLGAASAYREAQRAQADLTLDQRRAEINLEMLTSALGINEAAVRRLAERAGVDLADGTGTAVKAVKDLYFATMNGTPASDRLAGAMGTLSDASATAEDQLSALKTALDAVFGIAMGVSEASDAYQAALDDLTASVAQNGASLDAHTEKGRANRAGLRGIWQATLDLVQAQAANGVSAEEQRATLERGLAAFRQTATDAGLAAGEVDALAAELNATPDAISTAVTVTGVTQVLQTIETIEGRLRTLTSGTRTIRIRGDNVTGGLAGAKARGGAVLETGAYLVGEEGPEIVRLRSGSSVMTAAQTASALRPASSSQAVGVGAAAGGGLASRPLELTLVTNLDGRPIAESTRTIFVEDAVNGRDLGFR